MAGFCSKAFDDVTDSATETRCPACHTVFAVEAEDLARAGGKVRCGDCMHVFDAVAHATSPTEPGEPTAEHESEDDAVAEEVLSDDASDAPADVAVDIGDDLAANIDDEQFTSTNWFIVDEAGDLAPIDATTNDADTPDDAGELVFGSDPEPDPDDSGAFRFGDDTPPDTLRAELAALVGEDLVDNDDDAGEDVAGIAALSDDAPAPEASVTTGSAEADSEGDWDDLLGELDGALEAGDDVDLDFELVDADEAGNETSVDLDLTRATGQTAQPDFELPDDALMSATSNWKPALEDPGASELDADVGTELTLAGEAETEAESALSLDADALPELTLEADSDDASSLLLESEASAELSLYIEGASAPQAAPEPEPEPEPPSALEREVESAERALDEVTDDAFDAGALDDLMAAAAALDSDDLEFEAEPSAGGATPSDDDTPGDDAISAEVLVESPAADDVADFEQTASNDAADEASSARAVGEDTINAMAEGERGEVIVLGGDDAPAQEVASAVTEFATDAAASEEPEDDPSFAESMIISPDLAPKAPRRTGLWLTLSLLALIGLAAQAVHAWRNALVTQPYFEDVLPTVYRTLGMDLTPAWDIRQWCVETSGALASEVGLDVESVFSNRGDSALPPPVVKVRIVDAYSDTLAATVIEPRDYLSGAVPERVAPGGRITALARLDYNEPRLDGYEVSLCYAGEDGALRCGTGCPGND